MHAKNPIRVVAIPTNEYVKKWDGIMGVNTIKKQWK